MTLTSTLVLQGDVEQVVALTGPEEKDAIAAKMRAEIPNAVSFLIFFNILFP